jgi:hypothetical protein
MQFIASAFARRTSLPIMSMDMSRRRDRFTTFGQAAKATWAGGESDLQILKWLQMPAEILPPLLQPQLPRLPLLHVTRR